MNRHELREQVFKLLFRVEFNEPSEMEEQKNLFFDDDECKASDKDAAYITARYEMIEAKLPELDAMINEKADNWSTGRMGKVELTILRLALFELKFDEQIPTGVAIDEAVELAKKFGQEGSGAFVNGILAKFA